MSDRQPATRAESSSDCADAERLAIASDTIATIRETERGTLGVRIVDLLDG
jgi:hypothetical protein